MVNSSSRSLRLDFSFRVSRSLLKPNHANIQHTRSYYKSLNSVIRQYCIKHFLNILKPYYSKTIQTKNFLLIFIISKKHFIYRNHITELSSIQKGKKEKEKEKEKLNSLSLRFASHIYLSRKMIEHNNKIKPTRTLNSHLTINIAGEKNDHPLIYTTGISHLLLFYYYVIKEFVIILLMRVYHYFIIFLLLLDRIFVKYTKSLNRIHLID